MHIITKYDTTSRTTAEENQVRLLANSFSDSIKEQLDLDGSHPTSSILKSMCGEESDILIKKLVIFEPVYSRTVTKTSKGKIAGTNLDIYDFEVTYSIDNWIVYNINFDGSNNYIGFTKDLRTGTDAPLLENGNEAEGATIEATLGTKFNGVRNIFAGINTTPPTVQENVYQFGSAYNNLTANHYDLTGTEGAIFSATPTQVEYDIEVTQSVDIVVAHQDSRAQTP